MYNETTTSNDRETEGSIGGEASDQVQGQEGDTTGVEKMVLRELQREEEMKELEEILQDDKKVIWCRSK